MHDADQPTSVDELVRAVEELRIAETIASRQQSRDAGLRGLERAAVVYVEELGQVEQHATPTGLARYLGISTAAVTHVLDRLTKAGLIRRERSATDRRQVSIHLAVDHGDPRLIDPLSTPLREVAASLEADERRTILRFLTDARGLLPRPHY
ncbi:MarR family transcriptional regulator [Rathayibacter sp. VKM Ac-2927]|uniref:MarR family transcriptional regulator n=1 Tax=Rathayibacter sp. VKM Ac-2927 TaxID=2929478 RepID=UPI001FB4AD6C|nr:MarR family transcriptional regulator [Rathayibacter sp. VKM Ac-2927]MCJ1688577.1 MarR family transcriptional regulator [Rathayibacter sp. VKM Ac-2927]